MYRPLKSHLIYTSVHFVLFFTVKSIFNPIITWKVIHHFQRRFYASLYLLNTVTDLVNSEYGKWLFAKFLSTSIDTMGEWEKSRLSFFYACVCIRLCWNINEHFIFILYIRFFLLLFVIAVILNPNDFDFLLSRGNNPGHINPRDSILERFDPILGRKSIAPAVLINRLEPSVQEASTTNVEAAAVPAPPTPPTSIVTPHSISTIKEVDSFLESSSPNRVDDQLISIKQSSVTNQCASSINERNNSSSKSKSVNTTVKLASAEKTEHSNSVISISGDGDNSQASSTTETYETASIGEPLKVSNYIYVYISFLDLFYF